MKKQKALKKAERYNYKKICFSLLVSGGFRTASRRGFFSSSLAFFSLSFVLSNFVGGGGGGGFFGLYFFDPDARAWRRPSARVTGAANIGPQAKMRARALNFKMTAGWTIEKFGKHWDVRYKCDVVRV